MLPQSHHVVVIQYSATLLTAQVTGVVQLQKYSSPIFGGPLANDNDVHSMSNFMPLVEKEDEVFSY